MCVFGLSDLSVYGRVTRQSSNVIFPDSVQLNAENNENQPSSERTTRQVNRRPVPQQTGGGLSFPDANQEDIFLGIDPDDNRQIPAIAQPQLGSALDTNGCINDCKARTTQQYNPVCGTDSQTYQNKQNLDCVANCGICKWIMNSSHVVQGVISLVVCECSESATIEQKKIRLFSSDTWTSISYQFPTTNVLIDGHVQTYLLRRWLGRSGFAFKCVQNKPIWWVIFLS